MNLTIPCKTICKAQNDKPHEIRWVQNYYARHKTQQGTKHNKPHESRWVAKLCKAQNDKPYEVRLGEYVVVHLVTLELEPKTNLNLN